MTRQKSLFAKVLALCLTLALAISMAVPTFGKTIQSNDEKGTVFVNGLESDEGESVNLYKLIDVHFNAALQQPEEPVYTWIGQVANWVKTNYPAYIDTQNQNAVTKAFSNASAKDLKAFYEAVGTALKNDPIPPIGGAQTFEKDTQTGAVKTQLVFENIPMGQYVAVVLKDGEISAHKHSPAVVNLVPEWDESSTTAQWVLNDVEVNLKGQSGEIEKNVVNEDDKAVAIGDTVEYRLDTLIPSYPEDTTDTKVVSRRFEIGDKLSKGLTFDNNLVVKIGTDPKTAAELPQSYYSVDYNKVLNDSKLTFLIEMNNDKYLNLKKDYPNATHVYVEYSATVNEYAFETDALGNSSFVGIDTNPYTDDSYDTVPVEKEVYTYGVDVLKVDENNDALPGAEFKLYKDQALENEVKFVKVSDGIYRVAKADETGVALAVDQKGKLQLQGLDLGTYYLKESKAPAGYNLLQTAVEFTLADENADGVLNNDDDNIYNTISVQNTKGFDLPITGGMGTVVFTAVGIVLMAGGVLLIVAMKKKSTQK